MKLVLGVDPGVGGALVLVDYDARKVVDLFDMQVIAKGSVSLIDPVETMLWLAGLEGKDVIGFVELVTTWSRTTNARGMDPVKQGAIAGRIAKLIGLARGLEVLLTLAGIPWQHVTPASWKGRAGLLKKPKETSLGVARMQLAWPVGTLSRVWHLGRAEAGLIALHGQAPDRVPRKPRLKLSEVMMQRMAENVPPGNIFTGSPS